MLRLVLMIAFVLVVAIAFIAVVRTLSEITQPQTGKETDDMPAKFRRVTYVLLVVLLFGVTSGWLGAV